MEKTAPLNNADRIRKPLLVVPGENDPGVPFTESEQIVAKVHANGQPVWYLRGEHEGRGFARKENGDFEFCATVLILEQTLAKQPARHAPPAPDHAAIRSPRQLTISPLPRGRADRATRRRGTRRCGRSRSSSAGWP